MKLGKTERLAENHKPVTVCGTRFSKSQLLFVKPWTSKPTHCAHFGEVRMCEPLLPACEVGVGVCSAELLGWL